MGAKRIVLALTLWLAGASASFAEYPERPIRLLLPFPAGTPQAIIDRLAAASAEAAHAPDIVERLQRDGIDAVGGTPAELAALIAREIPQWRELAKAADIRLQ
jgi:tripartite-type tricarboxylate transporter receptor subunit TctC